MSNWFTLTLDTTPPQIEIIAPQYTLQDIYTEITIRASEALMNWQQVYIIDAQGQRHDLIFSFIDNQTLYGKIKMNDYSIGIATIYCILKDTVANISSLYSKTINIYESNMLSVELSTAIRACELSATTRSLMLEVKAAHACELSETDRSVIFDEMSAQCYIEVTIL